MMRCYMRTTSRPLKRFILPVMLVAASVVNADNRDRDRKAIYGLIDSLVACWDRADARGISMLYQADGDIIVPDGSLLRGRNQIENFYSGVFAGGYGASTAIVTVGQLRFLSADLALVDGQFIVRRVLSANNQQLPPDIGFFSIIAQKVSGRWLIVASREMEPLLSSNTVTQPGEARPARKCNRQVFGRVLIDVCVPPADPTQQASIDAIHDPCPEQAHVELLGDVRVVTWDSDVIEMRQLPDPRALQAIRQPRGGKVGQDGPCNQLT